MLISIGYGSNIGIHENCDKNNSSYVYEGNETHFVFGLPNGMKTEQGRTYLAGSHKFSVKELEVFQVSGL